MRSAYLWCINTLVRFAVNRNKNRLENFSLIFYKKYDIIYIESQGGNVMFICSTCGKQFETKDALTNHFMKCWKEQHPYHKSKPAPRSEDVNTREDNQDILDFFNSFK